MTGFSATPIPQALFRRTPWKNGGGVTIDIADAYRDGASPGSWDAMIWRFGRTSIVRPGPFSDLTGYERMQLVVAGRGLVLETPAGEIDLREPLSPVRYDGGLAIESRLEHGPVEVVNLIADRRDRAIELTVVNVGERIALPAGRHIAYAGVGGIGLVLDGRSFEVPAGDALSIDADRPVAADVLRGPAIVASVMPRRPG